MEFPAPQSTGYTIYTKTDCSYCTKVKILLEELGHTYTAVNCDEYLAEKEAFLTFIRGIAAKEHKTFPIIFFDGKYIGGYDDTMRFLSTRYRELPN
jgi:glutaredoxin 3